MTREAQIVSLQERIKSRGVNKKATGPLLDRLIRLRLQQLKSEIRAERKARKAL